MRQNSCLAWSAAERVMCTIKKFVKSVSAQIMSKCCDDGVSQLIKWQIFSVLPIAFPLFMCRFQLMCRLTRTFNHGWQKSPKKQVLHLTCWALCADRTLHRNIALYSSQKVWYAFFGQDLSPGSLLSAFHFGMAIWNDWKRKSSHQEMMHKSGNWTKRYNLSAGLKRARWLAVAQPTLQTQKRHTHNWLLACLMPTHTHEIKNLKKKFFGGWV